MSTSIYGLDGNDTLVGSFKNDTLVGGNGSDTLHGGTGADTFVWSLADLDKSTDTVTGFNYSEGDTLKFEDLIVDDDHFNVSTAWIGNYRATVIQVDKDGAFHANGSLNANLAEADLTIMLPSAGTPSWTGYQALNAAFSGITDQQQILDTLVNKGILDNG